MSAKRSGHRAIIKLRTALTVATDGSTVEMWCWLVVLMLLLLFVETATVRRGRRGGEWRNSCSSRRIIVGGRC